MKLDHHRIKIILWRAWRGEDACAIAAAASTHPREVAQVLDRMRERLAPRRRGGPGRPRRQVAQDVIEAVYADWKAGRIKLKEAQGRAGLNRASLLLRFADLGDPQAKALASRRREQTRVAGARHRERKAPAPRAPAAPPSVEVAPAAPPAPEPAAPAQPGPVARPIPRDELLRLHGAWRRQEITLDQAAAQVGLSRPRLRLRFADIDDPALARRIRSRDSYEKREGARLAAADRAPAAPLVRPTPLPERPAPELAERPPPAERRLIGLREPTLPLPWSPGETLEEARERTEQALDAMAPGSRRASSIAKRY